MPSVAPPGDVSLGEKPRSTLPPKDARRGSGSVPWGDSAPGWERMRLLVVLGAEPTCINGAWPVPCLWDLWGLELPS